MKEGGGGRGGGEGGGRGGGGGGGRGEGDWERDVIQVAEMHPLFVMTVWLVPRLKILWLRRCHGS